MAGIRVTWRDVQEMPEDGNRYEAIDGEMYVTPAPKPRHGWISMSLARELIRVLVDPGHGRLFTAPVGVEFVDTEEGVQPDLLFVSTGRLKIVREDAIQGAPDLVIEILSPRTAQRDRTVKLQLYRRRGSPSTGSWIWMRNRSKCGGSPKARGRPNVTPTRFRYDWRARLSTRSS
jgi:Uma2 family endonuclease